MKRLTIYLAFISCPLALVLAGCGALPSAAGQKGEGREPAVFTAAEWNLQALFDGQEAGNEYAEYREAAGWTAEKYAARITAFSQAVLQMASLPMAGEEAPSKQKIPDLIGFLEVENTGVLGDLAGGALSKQGYSWIAFANLPGSSLGIGFISRYPLVDVRAHSITVGKHTAPRPVLELRLEPRGKALVFLLCHWKSKLGGDNATEAQRRSSARVVQRRLRELKLTEPDTPVIVMGDLNENHDEFYRRSVFSALLPDDPDAAELAARISKEAKSCLGAADFLVLSGEKPPRSIYFSDDVEALYSPWDDDLTDGSYYYKDSWETIDHVLLSDALFNGQGWEYAGCRVLNQTPFTASSGTPYTYVPRSGRGLSDHLPLLVHLRYSEDVRD